MQEGEPIEHRMVTRAIENAQKKVEGRNFDIRKHLLEYDDVMNKQRKAIYELRRDIFDGTEGKGYVMGVAGDLVDYLVATHCPEKAEPAEWTLSELIKDVIAYFDIDLHAAGLKLQELGDQDVREEIWTRVSAKYENKEQRLGSELMRMLERDVMLRYVDLAWKDHLFALDHLKEGIGLRGYGQRDPLQEYKKESYTLFQELKERVEDSVVKTLFRLEPASEDDLAAERARRERAAPRPVLQGPAGGASAFAAPAVSPGQPVRPSFGPPRIGGGTTAPPAGPATPPIPQTVHAEEKIGRNDPCPCGSGKKYKKCHGAAAGTAG